MAKRHSIRGYSTREFPLSKMCFLAVVKHDGEIWDVVQGKRNAVRATANRTGNLGDTVEIFKGNPRKPLFKWIRVVERFTIGAVS